MGLFHNQDGDMTVPKILIIEDDRIIANLTELRLNKIGYDVMGKIENPNLVIDYLSQNTPDLILMDIKLSDEIDGIALAGMIRKISKIPIVFLTALADDETIRKIKKISRHGYIRKPFNDDDLRAGIALAMPKK